MDTSIIYQGKYMSIHLTSEFRIPVASLGIFDIITVLILIPVLHRFVYPLLARFNIHLSVLQRVGIGMIFAAASMVCAGSVELYRVQHCCQIQDRGTNTTATNVSNITIFYQVPQYVLIGVGETLIASTGMELAYVEAPKSMQGLVMGFFLLPISLGSFAGAAVLAVTNSITGRNDSKDQWYPDVEYINEGKLARYFFLLAGLMALNFVLYIFVAINFKAKKEAASGVHVEKGYYNSASLRKESQSFYPSCHLSH